MKKFIQASIPQKIEQVLKKQIKQVLKKQIRQVLKKDSGYQLQVEVIAAVIICKLH